MTNKLHFGGPSEEQPATAEDTDQLGAGKR